MPVGAVTASVATKVLAAGTRKLAKGFVRNALRKLDTKEHVAAEWRKHVDEIAIETDAALRLFMQQHFAEMEAIRAELKAQGEELKRLCASLLEVAARAVPADRMRMMCAASVGVLTPGIDIEMKARVAEAVRTLHGSDVDLLRRIAGPEAQVIGKYFQNPGTQAIALRQSGCVYVSDAGFGGVSHISVTGLGNAVLAFLATWTPESSTAR